MDFVIPASPISFKSAETERNNKVGTFQLTLLNKRAGIKQKECKGKNLQDEEEVTKKKYDFFTFYRNIPFGCMLQRKCRNSISFAVKNVVGNK